MYKNILFDLDGTLTDPGIGITNAVSYALNKFGISVNERTELYKFIGPPLMQSFSEFYGLSENECRDGVKYYREYYSTTGLYENSLYDGITDMLSALKSHGYKIVLATSKPDKFSIEILKHFNLYHFFDFISAATMDETRCEKSDIVRYALDNIDNPELSIMVGDRMHDIIGAKNNSLKSIGVLYGYGSKEELLENGADYLAESPADIVNLLINK